MQPSLIATMERREEAVVRAGSSSSTMAGTTSPPESLPPAAMRGDASASAGHADPGRLATLRARDPYVAEWTTWAQAAAPESGENRQEAQDRLINSG